jgi:hypothetical protein
VDRKTIYKNPEKMGDYIAHELEYRRLAKSDGCALAVELFGNGKPFSNNFIRNLPCMQQYKNQSRVIATRQRKTKRQLLKDIGKRLSTKALQTIKDGIENETSPYHNILMSLEER